GFACDQALLPDDDVDKYYLKGQGAHLFTLIRPIVGKEVTKEKLNSISEFGLVMQNKLDFVVGFIEKAKMAGTNRPDRLKILQSVLGHSIRNLYGNDQIFYDKLFALAEPYINKEHEYFQGWAKAKSMELLMFPALLEEGVYNSLKENTKEEGIHK